MTAYTLGVLFGRLLMSALMVYSLLLIFNRFKAGTALRRLVRPLPIVSVLVLFVLGFVGSVQAEENSAKRPFAVTDFNGAGLTVYVPDRPAWYAQVEDRPGTQAVLLSTPENYYPPASMEIILNPRHRLSLDALQKAAVSGLNVVREKSGVSERITAAMLKPVTYGDILAYEDHFEMHYEGADYSVKSVLGRLPSGKPITLFLATPKGQLDHIEPMVKKIWDHLSEIPKR